MTDRTPETPADRDPADPDSFEVACVRCAGVFEGFAPTQAVGCAADIEGATVTGFDGSTVADMRRLTFRDPHHGLPEGQICDTCIAELEAAGALVATGHTEPFGAFSLADEIP